MSDSSLSSSETSLSYSERSSRLEVFCTKDVLKNFAKFTGKHLCQSLFFSKVADRCLIRRLGRILNVVFTFNLHSMYQRGTSAKTYWLILKTFANDKKVPVIPPLLVNSELICNFRTKLIIWTDSLTNNVQQFPQILWWDINLKANYFFKSGA